MAEPKFLVLDDHIASSVQKAVDQTFSAAFQIPTKMDVWHVGRNVPLVFDSLHAAQIVLTQQSIAFGFFIAAFNHSLLTKVLNLETVQEQDVAALEDAAGEITNMLYGLFKASVNGEGYGLAMGLPKTLAEKERGENAFAQWEKLCLPFSADGQKCWVAIVQNH